MLRNLVGKKVKTFNIIKMIGQGQSGVVFQALDELNNQLVAIKAMVLKKIKSHPKLWQQVETEIFVLKNCQNPNVIKFIDSFQANQFLFIVTEFCNGGSVEQRLLTSQLTEDEAVAYLKQILNGFKGLHEVSAIHRDFKLANILLHDGICKIADLGSSKQLTELQMAKTTLGTPLTNAPEILDRLPYGFQADIWSIGIVFYQMLYGRYPYLGVTDSTLLQDIKSRRPDYGGFNISEKSKDFIERCLTVNPSQRIRWNQIYAHPLIASSNANRTLNHSFLTKRISLNQNKQFYDNLDNQQMGSKLEITKSDLNESQRQMLSENDFKSLQNMDELIKKADKIKKNMQIKERFDKLYIGKRNDLMFFNQFIQPYLNGVLKIKVNHWVAGFILAKKSYLELCKLHESIVNNRVIFYGQNDFEWYSKHENYAKVRDQVNADVICMEKTCLEYKQKIRISSLEIMNQFEMKETKNRCFDKLVHEIVAEYSSLLVHHLDTTKQDRPIFIRLIMALDYYNNNPKLYSHEFDRIISTANFEDIQQKMRNKYHIN